MKTNILLAVALLLGIASAKQTRAEEPSSPAPQATLQQWLTVDWQIGTDLPQGLQDSD